MSKSGVKNHLNNHDSLVLWRILCFFTDNNYITEFSDDLNAQYKIHGDELAALSIIHSYQYIKFIVIGRSLKRNFK